ncbi:MAG: TylF/MycF/NovP-related O-methyltransferase [Minisyncoccia bacterium]
MRARHGVVIFFQDKPRRDDLDTVHKVSKETKMLISDHEAYQLMMAVRRTKKIPGDIAEVGTYRGGSSKLIAIARGDDSAKHIYLFDTFEGLPPLTDIDRTHFTDDQYPADLAEVTAYLAPYPNVSLHKGIFPQSAGPILDKRFSFVHLDVDLYEATRDAIKFFYPRMERGAVLISHDYSTAPGVRKAIDEFMADKPEAVFESSWRQCFIVKI